MRNIVSKNTLRIVRENCPQEINDINKCIEFIIETKNACSYLHDMLLDENKKLRLELHKITSNKVVKLLMKLRIIKV